MGLIRTLVSIVVLSGMVWCGTTVKIGERTTWGHFKNIWSADETQELVEGVKDKSGPVVDRVKRGVKAGLKEPDAGSPNEVKP